MRKQRDGPSATIVVSADHHLGYTAPNLSSSQISARAVYLREEFRAMISYCLKQSVSALLLAGDTFDTPSPSPDDVSWVARHLQSLQEAGTIVAAITGDSDATEPNTASAIDLLDQMGVLHSVSPGEHSSPPVVKLGNTSIPILGLAVDSIVPKVVERRGIPKVVIQAPDDILSQLQKTTAKSPQILLTHAFIEGISGDGATGPTIQRKVIEDFGGLWLLVGGHNHAPAQDKIGQTTVVMPGSPLGTGGFMTIELTLDGVQDVQVVESRGIPKVVIHAQGSDFASEDSASLLKMMVEGQISRDSEDSEVVLQLHGETDQASLHRASLSKLARWATTRCTSFEVDLTDLQIVTEDPETARESVSLIEDVQRIAVQIAGQDKSMTMRSDQAAELVLSALGRESRQKKNES